MFLTGMFVMAYNAWKTMRPGGDETAAAAA
jgi:cbb3-type cytochrome oxidase subunit 1